MNLSRILNMATLVAVFVAGPAIAETQIAFDTLGESNSFDPNVGWGIGGGPFNSVIGRYVLANQFVSQSTGSLSQVELPILRLQGSSPLILSLLADSNGMPGSTLATTHELPSGNGGIVKGVFKSDVALAASSSYWLAVSTSDPEVLAIWNWNTKSIEGQVAFTGEQWQLPGDWYIQNSTLGAFRLALTSPVPEASIGELFAVGALTLQFCGKRLARRVV